MQYKFAKVVGLNTDTDAALVIISSDDPQNLFLGILELAGDDAFTTGRQLLSDLADFYHENIGEKTTGGSLKETFAKASESLKDVGEYSVVIAGLSGKVLYLIGQGDNRSFLRRLDKISPLETSSAQLISGFLQDGDRVFFATKNLAEQIGGELTKILELPFEKWEEEMEVKINAHDKIFSEGESEDLNISLKRAGLIVDVAGDERPEEFIPASELVPEEGIESKIAKIKRILSFAGYSKLKNYLPGSGRARLILAIILILLVTLGAGLKYKSFKDQENLANFNKYLQQAEDNFKEAQALKTLNPNEASPKLSSAKENLEKALAINSKDSNAQALKKQVELEEGGITQKFEGNFTQFLDLDLIKRGFKARNLSISVGKLLVLSSEDATLAIIDIPKKSQKILSGKDKLGEANYASINGPSVFVYSKDKGVIRFDVGSGEASTAAKLDKDWGEISDIVGFGGNIYLLDKEKDQIWKYLAISSGYSDKRNYLNGGVKADFSGSLRMQIDSSIYALNSGGEILRFTRGDRDHFSIGGLDKGIKDPKSFFTSSDTESLYILDSGNSRLVVLSKTGEYKGQYSGDKFGTSTDLVVDEIGKKVYLLEGSKIWVMELR